MNTKIALIQRQTLDWGGPGYSNEMAAERHVGGSYVNLSDDKRRGVYEEVVQCLNLWDSTFSMKFCEVRRELKKIAHRSWNNILDLEKIYWDMNSEDINAELVNRNSIVLFSDDDDWYAPNVIEGIVAGGFGKEHVACLWLRTKFDGTYETSPLNGDPIYAFTNNYALNGMAFVSGTSIRPHFSHVKANRIIVQNLKSTRRLDKGYLSVTNKAPCSLNMMRQVRNSEDPKAELVSRVAFFANSPLNPSQELEWSRDYAEESQSVMRAALA